MTVAFDTLKFAQTLRDKAKVPQDQAEGMAQAFADATGDELVTKSDLKETERRLKSDLKEYEARSRADFKEVRADLKATELRLETKIAEVRGELNLVKWMLGFVLAILVALLFLAIRR